MGNKMQWLIDAFNKNTLDKTFKFRICYGKKDFGTVCMPTGTGKSGVMIDDILRRVKSPYTTTIVNLSCPTLRLSEQFVCDLFETMHGVFPVGFMKKVCLVLNSSDSPSNYSVGSCDIYGGDLISSIEKAVEYHSVIILASCHRSLYKFVSCTDELSKHGVCILNYIDESHLLPYKVWSDGEEDFRVDLHKLHCNSKALYLFSATPDYDMTREFTDNEAEPYIYKMYPVDAINENIILPPRIRCIRCNKISDSNLYLSVLKECKKFGGNRKVLVTLRNTDDLRDVRQTLENLGYKVFSATSADGFTGEDDLTDAVEFADAVDKWDGDCFVLQIKQLTQGTDIRTLTDCILPVADEINSRTYRNLIQTMGRVLRAAPGERGMPYNQRVKKAGNIFFTLTMDANRDKERCMRRFALRYYGMECTLYGEKFLMPAEITYEIDDTKKRIQQYILDKKDSLKLNIELFGSPISEEASDVLEEVDPSLYYHKRKSGIPEYHLLDNRLLLEYAEATIRKLI